MDILSFVLAMISALLFGAATPISKPLLGYLSSFQLAGLLYLGAAIGVLFLIVRRGGFVLPWKMDRKNSLRLAGSVLFGGILGPLALMAGLRLASAASVSLWLNLEMVATAILGHFFFNDHLTKRGWLAAGGILAAATILVFGEGFAGWQAGLLIAAACTCWGIDNHLTALIDGITPAQSTFWKGLVAGSTNLFIGLSLEPLHGPFWTVPAGLIIGVFAYGISIVLYISSAQRLGATRAQLIFSSSPFFGVLLSVVVLGEKLSWQHGVAALFFIGSILLLSREQHSHIHTHQPQFHEHYHTHTDGHHDHHSGDSIPVWHTHPHAHDALTHAHVHSPDLHHRHAHEDYEQV